MTDCGDSSCRYAATHGGMRTNGGCRCDQCPCCGQHITRLMPLAHRPWCTRAEWQPPWARGEAMTTETTDDLTCACRGCNAETKPSEDLCDACEEAECDVMGRSPCARWDGGDL